MGTVLVTVFPRCFVEWTRLMCALCETETVPTKNKPIGVSNKTLFFNASGFASINL